MILAPRMIAIDDNPEQLKELATAINSLGGGCECIDVLDIPERTSPYGTGIRIVFMDINLIQGSGMEGGAQTFSPIKNALESLLNAKNGPYALITWTNNPELHDKLIEYLCQELDQQIQPSANLCIEKAEYLNQPALLRDKIGQLKQDLPGLSMLLDWERGVIEAADSAVLEVVKLADEYGTAANGAISKAINGIAIAASGRAESIAQPFKALCSGMSNLLADKLDSIDVDTNVENRWKAFISDSPPEEIGENEKAALNTFFHIEKGEGNSQFGAVYELPYVFLSQYLPDPTSPQEQIIRSLDFVGPRTQAGNRGAGKKLISASCDWRFVRLGAACDHAQNKSQIAQGILAVKVDEAAFPLLEFTDEGTGRSQNTFIFQSPKFSDVLTQKKYVLLLNFRYPLSISKHNLADFNLSCRLSESLATQISQLLADFSTRPGIIEFR